MADLIVYLLAGVVAFAAELFSSAIAYRVHRGVRGLDISLGELLLRSTYVAGFFCAFGLGGVALSHGLDLGYNGYVMASVVAIPLAAQIINWVFGLDDWPAALGIYFLRLTPWVVIGVGYVSVRLCLGI